MTLHAPAHGAHVADTGLLHDLLVILAAVVLATALVGLAVVIKPFSTSSASAERQSLVEFRAGERESRAAPMTTEGQSLIDFRAGERSLP